MILALLTRRHRALARGTLSHGTCRPLNATKARSPCVEAQGGPSRWPSQRAWLRCDRALAPARRVVAALDPLSSKHVPIPPVFREEHTGSTAATTRRAGASALS